MAHDWILWVLVAASGIDNGALIVLGVSCAAAGWRAPAFALGLPALALINAAFFHVAPSIAAKRPNPGLFTAVLLYLPVGTWCYIAAGEDHQLGALTVIGSVLIGAGAMASAIAIPRLGKSFRYPDAPA